MAIATPKELISHTALLSNPLYSSYLWRKQAIGTVQLSEIVLGIRRRRRRRRRCPFPLDVTDRK